MSGIWPNDPGQIAYLLSRIANSHKAQSVYNYFRNRNTPVAPVVNDVGRRIGASIGQLGQELQQTSNPLTDLYTKLLDQLQTPVAQPAAIDKNAIMHQVQDALNPIYDQRINAATNQTKRNQADVKNMYASLAQDYKNLIPQQQAQNAANQQQVKDIYGELRSNIEGSYSRVSNEQADLFNQLGIQSALPSVLDQQDNAVTDATTAASQNQAQEQQMYMDQGNADQTYYQEQVPIANMTGVEVNSNLMSQLNDYLNQINAERSSGIQSGYLDQLAQAQSAFGQQQQAAQTETARRQEMLWQMLQAQSQSSSKANPLDQLMSQLSPQMQQSVANAFTQLQRSPESIYGKTEDPRNPVPGSFVDTTPEWYYAQADQMLQSGQIDEATHQVLLQYLQLYFGK